MYWLTVLLFFVAADQTEAFPYTTKRSKLYWGSQGQEKLLGDLGEKEGRAKVQIGEFIKRQNAGCKEFFLYRNLVFVGELCLQNTLNNVLGRSRQSCPDIRLCSCSGCAFSKEPWWGSGVAWGEVPRLQPLLLWIFFPGVGKAEQSPASGLPFSALRSLFLLSQEPQASYVSSSALCAPTSSWRVAGKGNFLLCMMRCLEKGSQCILIYCSLLFNLFAGLVGGTHCTSAGLSSGWGYCVTWEAES